MTGWLVGALALLATVAVCAALLAATGGPTLMTQPRARDTDKTG